MKYILLFFTISTFNLGSITAQNIDYSEKIQNSLSEIFKTQNIIEEPIYSPKKQPVTVPAGEMVLFTLAETVDSEQMTIGQNIQFMVDKNVIVDGKIVIRTNAYALGRVKRKEKNTEHNSCRSTLTIEIILVQAVDGQLIPLNGQEQTFTSERSGLSVVIFTGKKITGTFKNNEMIVI